MSDLLRDLAFLFLAACCLQGCSTYDAVRQC